MINALWLIPTIVVLILILGMFVGVFVLQNDKLRAEILDLKRKRRAYEPKGKLLNGTEHHLYHLLKEFYSGFQYEIFVQVDLAAIIKVSDKALDYFGTIEDLDKSIDFVVADSETMLPILAIELNGPEHSRDSRKVRDKFIDKIFSDCNIPFIAITPTQLIDPEKLKTLLFEAMKKDFKTQQNYSQPGCGGIGDVATEHFVHPGGGNAP